MDLDTPLSQLIESIPSFLVRFADSDEQFFDYGAYEKDHPHAMSVSSGDSAQALAANSEMSAQAAITSKDNSKMPEGPEQTGPPYGSILMTDSSSFAADSEHLWERYVKIGTFLRRLFANLLVNSEDDI
jgi:hypothetical protein